MSNPTTNIVYYFHCRCNTIYSCDTAPETKCPECGTENKSFQSVDYDAWMVNEYGNDVDNVYCR